MPARSTTLTSHNKAIYFPICMALVETVILLHQKSLCMAAEDCWRVYQASSCSFLACSNYSLLSKVLGVWNTEGLILLIHQTDTTPSHTSFLRTTLLWLKSQGNLALITLASRTLIFKSYADDKSRDLLHLVL